MGFYIRKSLGVGPLRFNLSKSGIGVSAGITGFRVGAGPKGTYIHMGRGGLYYRQALSRAPQRVKAARRNVLDEEPSSELPATHGPMTAIGSGCVTEMRDTNSGSLLAELDRKRSSLVLWPIGLIAGLMLLFALLLFQCALWITIPFLFMSLGAVFFLYQQDQIRKNVVLMYELDGPILGTYQNLLNCYEEMGKCGAVWHVNAKGVVHNSKYHAGAGQLSSRQRVHFVHRNPPNIKTNLPIPALRLDRLSLYFLPDRILVYSRSSVGAVDYRDVVMSMERTRFVENGTIPRDANVVDYTWRYVNKNGGPDRRFKDNPQIPICEYEELELTSGSGIREILQISRIGVGNILKNAFADLGRMISSLETKGSPSSALDIDKAVHFENRSENSAPIEEQSTSLPSNKLTADLTSALFDILCCLMCVDGRASRVEKKVVLEIMASVGNPWSKVDGEGRISAFIKSVEANGYAEISRRSMGQLHQFRQAVHRDILLQSCKLVAKANGELNESEKRLMQHIRKSIGNHG